MFQKYLYVFKSKQEQVLSSVCYFMFGLMVAYLLFTTTVMASGGGDASLPFMGPLEKLKDAISGPFAFAVSILAIAGAGLKLALDGGEMGQFMKMVLILVLIIGLVVGANSFMTSFMGASAVVNPDLSVQQTEAVMMIVKGL